MNFIKASRFLASLLILLSVSALTTGTIPNTILDCGSANKLQLGTTKRTITYRSIEYNKNCDWTIPNTVRNNEYALVLVLKNVTLPKSKIGCEGSIRLPRTFHTCQFTPSYCLVYATNPTLCNFQTVTRTIQNYNTSACTSFTTWSNTDTAKIQYHAADRANVYKEFVLYYLPVYCIEQTTTTTTSTTTTTTTTTTTLSTTTLKTGDIATSGTSRKTDSSTNSKSLLPPSNTEGQEAPATCMDVSTIGLIVGAVALILLLGIGNILLSIKYHKSINKSSKNKTTPTEGAKYVRDCDQKKEEEYEIPRNITEYENVTVDNKQYETVTY